jgi:WD40 repeat protein
MNKEPTPIDKKFLIPFIIVILFAAYNIIRYFQYETELKNMRGAEWIDYDAEGHLYFTHHENVYRLSSNNASLDKFIETGLNISTRDIMDIAIAPSGVIFLTDPTSGEIHIYSNKGVLQQRLKGHFKENARIVVDNKKIYLADMQGNRIIALDIKNGELLWTDEDYFIPDSLFVKKSIVYVSDETIREIRLLNAENGRLIKTIRINFSGFSYGSSILVLDDGTILLAPSYTRNGSLMKVSGNGEPIKTISGPDGFMPVDMALSPEGYVMITDDENYSFYNVKDDVVELLESSSIEELFGDMKTKRTALKGRALNSRLLLIGCIMILLVLYVKYRRPRQKDAQKPGRRSTSGVILIIYFALMAITI